MLDGRIRHDKITNTEVFELLDQETNMYKDVAVFKLILMCKMKVYENDMTYDKTEFITQSNKDKEYNRTIDTWTKNKEDSWELTSNWISCFESAITSRSSSLWKGSKLLLYQTFKESVLKNSEYNKAKQIEVYESLMLTHEKTDNVITDYKIECPDLGEFHHGEITIENQNKVIIPINSKNVLYKFKKIVMNNKIDELTTQIVNLARSDEELIIYKTIMSWVVLNLLKRQLIELHYPLYPAIILIGEKKTGKSTATKLFCDMGFDYNCTGRDTREAVLKQKFSSVFPIMFSEIEWVLDEQMDSFKEALTHGQFIINKGKNTGGAQGWRYRLINPFIFNTNQFTMQDDALKRRFYAINYPMPPNDAKLISSFELKEVQENIQGFYKWMFYKWLPENVTLNKLKEMIKKTRNFENETFSFMQLGELLLDEVGILKEVRLINLDLEGDESFMVVKKDLIMKEIRRVISSRDLTLMDKKDDTLWTIKHVMENKNYCFKFLDMLANYGVYFKKNKDFDTVCIDATFISLMKEKIANQFKKIDTMGKKLDKGTKRMNVHTSQGGTTKIALGFSYEELFGEMFNGHEEEEEGND